MGKCTPTVKRVDGKMRARYAFIIQLFKSSFGTLFFSNYVFPLTVFPTACKLSLDKKAQWCKQSFHFLKELFNPDYKKIMQQLLNI